MEKIPGSLAEAKELFPLLALSLWAVSAGSKGTATGRRRPMAQGWAAAILVFCACATLVSILVTISLTVAGSRRRWRRGLVTAIVHKLGQ